MSYYDDIPRDALEAAFDYEDDRPTLADCDFDDDDLDDDDKRGYCRNCGTDWVWNGDEELWYCPNCSTKYDWEEDCGEDEDEEEEE